MAGVTIGATSLIISTDDRQFQKGLTSAGLSFKRFRKQVDDDSKSIKKSTDDAFAFTSGAGGLGAWKSLGLIGGAGAGLLGGFSLAGLVTDSIKLASEVEDTATAFEVLVGDATRAKELFADIREFAAKTPMTTQELA